MNWVPLIFYPRRCIMDNKVSCFYTKLETLRSMVKSFVETYKTSNGKTDPANRSYIATTIPSWCSRRGFIPYTPDDAPIMVYENKESYATISFNKLTNVVTFTPGPFVYGNMMTEYTVEELLSDMEWTTENIAEFVTALGRRLKEKCHSVDDIDNLLQENGFDHNLSCTHTDVWANQNLHCRVIAMHSNDTYYLAMSGPMEKYGRYRLPLSLQVCAVNNNPSN